MNQRFTKIRKTLGLTQEAFAQIIELSRDAYAKIENGKNKPTPDTLITLHNKLNININWLLCGSGRMKIEESVINELNEPLSQYGLRIDIDSMKETIVTQKKLIAALEREIEDLKSHSGDNRKAV
jgi:Predicted transcriptional regulators